MTYEEKDLVHEDFTVTGSTGYLTKDIIQIPFLTYSEILKKTDRYSDLGARKILSRNKSYSTLNIAMRSIWAFFRIYIFRLGFLDGWQGFVIAFCNMEGTLLRYAKYKELVRKAND